MISKNLIKYIRSLELKKNRQKEGVFADYAAKNKVVRQLIDLALLQNGMLKGEALNNFVKRSIDLIK
jgi:molecular chaperone HtpG